MKLLSAATKTISPGKPASKQAFFRLNKPHPRISGKKSRPRKPAKRRLRIKTLTAGALRLTRH